MASRGRRGGSAGRGGQPRPAPAAAAAPDQGGGRRLRAPAVVPGQSSAQPPVSYSQTATPAAATHNVASSSSAPVPSESSSASAAQLVKEVEGKLTLQRPSGLVPPKRPGFGTSGTKCFVRANHFLVQLSLKDICHYDVTITPEVASKKVCREVISELVRLYKESHLGEKTIAYDGRKSFFTAGSLPFESKEFVVKLPEKERRESSSKRKDREFKVNIKLASQGDTHHLQQFLKGLQLDSPQETIQALDVVLRQNPSIKYTVVGRSFFNPDLCINDDPRSGRGDLGEGLEYWRGYYQSLRPTQFGLSLNIDLSARAFYDPVLVTEFILKHFNFRDLSRPLSDQDRIKVKKAIRGVKVELVHREYARSCKISGISNRPANQTLFTLDDQQTSISVVEYFCKKYNIVVKYPNLPCLQAGSDAKPVYLPMEVCKIVPGQRYTKKLNERQVTNLLRITCQRPLEREHGIDKIVKATNAASKDIAKDFGMIVNGNLTKVPARVLPAPRLNYHPSGEEPSVDPRFGQWNMMNKKMIDGARIDAWACINFSTRLDRNVPFEFCKQLINMCNNKGMVFNPQPVLDIRSTHPNQIEKALADIHKESMAKLASRKGAPVQLQLLIIVLPDFSGTYGRIKRVCETELGLISQCCQPRQISKNNLIQYCENVALKINVKVGGRNTVLRDAVQGKIPFLTDMPTIILGADVTHPQPGDDSSPSIAAVVASMDWPGVTKYRCLVSAQSHREEIIEDLYKVVPGEQGNVVHKSMIMDHLKAFRRSTGHKPSRIIFYRDGVSEGQFNQVLLYEIDAIRKACAKLEAGYQPRITFVVVQKRHHTRLFPEDYKRRDTMDRSGNILPGTVVDTGICHPSEFDFYLNSHAGIQGTSRPAHYHVLYDENNFTADGLQLLTNNLCYTYARCTRAVSIVPPAYYAHLAAFRARYYIEGDGTDGSSSGGRGVREGTVELRHLPAIKDNVLNVMFFC